VLIIKPSAIGDVVHALPILNLLRTHWPQSHIAWLVTPACAGLLEDHPQLDEVIPFERRLFGQAWKNPKAAARLYVFQKELRARKFDLVIDLQGLFRSAWLAKRSGAPIRVGFANARELAWTFYTHRVPVHTLEQHAIDRYLSVLEFLGLPKAPVDFVFPTSGVDRDHISQFLPRGKRYAVLLPGTNWLTKRWPTEHFASLIRPLYERHGLTTVLAGSPDEVSLCEQVYRHAATAHPDPRALPPVINLAGKTTLRQLVALLRDADLVLANDSGPMHIASALGRPLVTLFGPTSPLRTGPYNRLDTVLHLDIPCSPCYSRKCSHHSCLKLLGPLPALNLATQQLQNSSAPK
jgi:lipopolysaccharide heptosyltransferase I